MRRLHPERTSFVLEKQPASRFKLRDHARHPFARGEVGKVGVAVASLQHEGLLPRLARVRAELYGSLGATGKGHGTDKAVVLGLQGDEPDKVDVDSIERIEAARKTAMAENKGKYILVVEGAIPTKDGGVYCKIGGKTAIHVYRVVQESLTNVARHSGSQ